jgi:hypothetical protein
MDELLHHHEDEPQQLKDLRERRRRGSSVASQCGLFAKSSRRFSYLGNATGPSQSARPMDTRIDLTAKDALSTAPRGQHFECWRLK